MKQREFLNLIDGIERPSQYLGNETNAIHKNFAEQKVRVALVFPDLYEMGMSHMGQKILYEILNSMDGVVAERVFAPALDLEKRLRDTDTAFFSLESKTPLHEFDLIGFSVPYELTYTNMLNVIDLAKIPLWQKDRKDHHPIVVAGGTSSYNPEPFADFMDVVAIGDGEEMVVDLVNAILEWKTKFNFSDISQNQNQGSRQEFLENLRHVPGVYVPSLFEIHYKDNGIVESITPKFDDYTHVPKRIVENLDAQSYPTKLVVPNTKLIHDRIGIEIQRGCTRMCRFCQAGYIERPTRQRSPETVLKIAEDSLNQTGIDEISLLSLSAGDYQTIVPTMKELNARYADRKISISVPATRTETLTPEMIAEVKQVRKTGFTIAPEAGTPRMRRVINKGNKREDLLQACENAFSAGYELIKFYYMCGLPFERDEDLIGIADETFEALQIGLKHSKRVKINVSVSSLVPKPFTPFQWIAQNSIDDIHNKHYLIKTNLKDKRLKFKHHDSRMSYLEGVFARGDRRLGVVLAKALEKGLRFDEWSEHFDFAKWLEVFEETGCDTDFYVARERSKDEVLPWDHLFSQMRKEWLWQEFEAARLEAYVADCSVEKCAQFCGVCDFKTVKNKIFVVDEKPLAAKKGNREWYGRFHENYEPDLNAIQKINLDKSQKYKYRVSFSKTDLAALHGHLELMTLMKRALQRLQIPVAYSEGFHPQMKLALGYALPLGVESLDENFDIVVHSPLDETFLTQMNEALPKGIVLRKIEQIDYSAMSLSAATESMDYEIELSEEFFKDHGSVFFQQLENLNQGQELYFKRERKGKKSKVLPIHELVKNPSFENETLKFKSVCQQEGMIKPFEFVMALAGTEIENAAQVKIKKVATQLKG